MTTNAKSDEPAIEAWGEYVQAPVNVKAFQFVPFGDGAHRNRMPMNVKAESPARGPSTKFWVTVQVGDYVFDQQIEPGDWIAVTSDGNWRVIRAAVFDANFAPVPKPKPVGYGRCPTCGAECISRERRPNGNDMCSRGHTYASSTPVH